MSLKTRSKGTLPQTNEDIVHQYFNCIERRDVEGTLELFDYDAVLYEPFSKLQGLHGKSAIEPFLKVAMMANNTLRRTIKFQKPLNGKDESNKVVADVIFEKGDKVRGRFTFEFTNGIEGVKKIKSLHIEFP